MNVKGRDLKTGLPKEQSVTSTELMEAFKRPARQIVDEVLSVLEHSSPELVAGIAKNAAYLALQILALQDIELSKKLKDFRAKLAEDAAASGIDVKF